MEIMDLAPLKVLTKDLKTASKTLGDSEARFLVDSYYALQEFRISSGNQVRQLATKEDGTEPEPHQTLAFFNEQFEMLEEQIKKALDAYSNAHEAGVWARSVLGIGPVISAGLLAYINIDTTPSPSSLWRFAGLDPTSKWEKGEKRPWNAGLKVLCVVPGSHITTKRGHVPIEDVLIGDEVLTHLGRWRKVTNVMVNDHDGPIHGLRSARAGNSVAWLTPGHPVYAASVETWKSDRTRTYKINPATQQAHDWHAVETVKPRWKLSRPVIEERSEIRPVLVLSGLEVGNGLVAAVGQWKNTPAPRAHAVPQVVELTERMMYLIGLYLAEGHIQRTRVIWSFHINETLLHQIVIDACRDIFGIEPNLARNEPSNAIQISIGNKPLAESFAEKFGTSSHTTKFPMEWLSLPTSLLEALWNGVMDGDGDHVGKMKGIRITTVSGTFARQVMDLGRRLGKSVSLHAETKRNAYRVIVGERNDRTPRSRKTLEGRYAGPVYNLEVEEDHSYIVEGYAVHNCWKIGESFVKVSGNEKAVYGKIYADKKLSEIAKNEQKSFADQAARVLSEKKIGKTTDAYKAYSQGMLPPAHIHARAKRYAVKLFLSHFWQVAYEAKNKKRAPRAYAFEHLGHVHEIPPPNWTRPA